LLGQRSLVDRLPHPAQVLVTPGTSFLAAEMPPLARESACGFDPIMKPIPLILLPKLRNGLDLLFGLQIDTDSLAAVLLGAPLASLLIPISCLRHSLDYEAWRSLRCSALEEAR
jgi:hypothetical protein